MKRSVFGCCIVLVFALTALANDPAAPQATFGRRGITVSGIKPGSKIAWLGFIVDPRGYHARMRLSRGFEPVTGQSSIEIAESGADESRGLWAFVDVSTGKALHARAPGARSSSRPISIELLAGKSSFAVRAGAIELLYVRPPSSAWFFRVADGGALDGDREQNGVIVVSLQSMEPFKGNPHPPGLTASGDVLLAIDPWHRRTATLEIGR